MVIPMWTCPNPSSTTMPDQIDHVVHQNPSVSQIGPGITLGLESLLNHIGCGVLRFKSSWTEDAIVDTRHAFNDERVPNACLGPLCFTH